MKQIFNRICWCLPTAAHEALLRLTGCRLVRVSDGHNDIFIWSRKYPL